MGRHVSWHWIPWRCTPPTARWALVKEDAALAIQALLLVALGDLSGTRSPVRRSRLIHTGLARSCIAGLAAERLYARMCGAPLGSAADLRLLERVHEYGNAITDLADRVDRLLTKGSTGAQDRGQARVGPLFRPIFFLLGLGESMVSRRFEQSIQLASSDERAVRARFEEGIESLVVQVADRWSQSEDEPDLVELVLELDRIADQVVRIMTDLAKDDTDLALRILMLTAFQAIHKGWIAT